MAQTPFPLGLACFVLKSVRYFERRQETRQSWNDARTGPRDQRGTGVFARSSLCVLSRRFASFATKSPGIETAPSPCYERALSKLVGRPSNMLDFFRQKGLTSIIYGVIIVGMILVFVLGFNPSAGKKLGTVSEA